MDNKGQAFTRSLAQNGEKGTLTQKRRPKGDPNPQKGPLGNLGPLKGTRVPYRGPNWAQW